MRMPDEFSFKPLTARPLIAKLHTDLVDVPLNMLHSPFAQPNPLAAILHRTDVRVHGLQDCRVPDCRVTLHQSQRLSFTFVSRRSCRR